MEIQPIDLTQLLVAIITTGGVIFSVWKRKLEPSDVKKQPTVTSEKPSKHKTWTIVIFIGLILLAVNTGIFAIRLPLGTEVEIEITYPYNDALVEITEMVRGTSQEIPEEHAIWIVIYPHVAGRYYPQNNPADVQADGDWTSLIAIGIEDDVDKKFDIIAALANQEAQDVFNAYLEQAKGKATWPGLEKLPTGTEIYARITVTRK